MSSEPKSPSTVNITSIPLYQIFGAPLMAIVDAEIQAAQATFEFIEKLAFSPHETADTSTTTSADTSTTTSAVPPTTTSAVPPTTTSAVPLTTTSANTSDEISKKVEDKHFFGELRTIHFTYTKGHGDSKNVVFRISIPILSLVPIPYIYVSDAQIVFAVEINGAVELDSKIQLSAPKFITSNNALEDKLVMFKGYLARNDSKSAMKVTLNVKNSHMPTGMSALLNIMEQGIHMVSNPENEKQKKEQKNKSETDNQDFQDE